MAVSRPRPDILLLLLLLTAGCDDSARPVALHPPIERRDPPPLALSPAPEEEVPSARIAHMDNDDDAQVSRDEFGVSMVRAFQAADRNGDGVVTRLEFAATFGSRYLPYFDVIDRRRVGRIPSRAFQESAARVFAVLDRDKDGHISDEERRSAEQWAWTPPSGSTR